MTSPEPHPSKTSKISSMQSNHLATCKKNAHRTRSASQRHRHNPRHHLRHTCWTRCLPTGSYQTCQSRCSTSQPEMANVSAIAHSTVGALRTETPTPMRGTLGYAGAACGPHRCRAVSRSSGRTMAVRATCEPNSLAIDIIRVEEATADRGLHLEVHELLLPFVVLLSSKVRVVLNDRPNFAWWRFGDNAEWG